MKVWPLAIALSCGAVPALAQSATSPHTDYEWMVWIPDPASLTMPQLAFQETTDAARDYDKYFYFHRDDTDFATALSDIRECDARARGRWRGRTSQEKDRAAPPYGLLGHAAQALFFQPAQDRLFRQASIRRCMFFKGYARYGLTKELWEALDFSRSIGDLNEKEIQTTLVRQALVASGPHPAARELGL